MKTAADRFRPILVLAGISLISACDNSSTTDQDSNPTDKASGTLERATAESLTDYFQQVLSDSSRAPSPGSSDGIALESNDTANTSPSSDTADFSSTTLQEAGVDEADLIKTDGEYIYSIYQNTENTFNIVEDSAALPEKPAEFSQGIRIMRANGAELNEVKNIAFANETSRLSGIYLANQNQDLIALSSGGNNLAYSWFYSPYFSQQTTDIQWLNISDPANAAEKHKLSFDGSLVSSRRVGDTLYLMLRHYPEIYSLEAGTSSGDVDLAGKTATDFLPKFQLDEQSQQIAVQPEDCFINAGAARQQADVVTLAAVNLTAAEPEIKTTCYVGSSEALYASTNALYLASTRWDYTVNGNEASYDPEVTTDIHKFAFQGMDFQYRGSAEVGGHLGWLQDRKSYRMSESSDGEYLRIVTQDEQRPWLAEPFIAIDTVEQPATAAASTTTNSAAESSPVMLTILKENQDKEALDIVSQLPNQNNPDPIGKPGEQLYASRFIGNRAYLVTFRVTDPLYILDLEDPLNPTVKGELEIDGYSDFLFNVGEDLLLGVGKDAVATSDETAFIRGGAWYQGVKLSLIDVADPYFPVEKDKVIIGKRGTESPALQTPHAISILKSASDSITRVALPVTLHETLNSNDYGPSTYYDYTRSGLHRYEIDLIAKRFITTLPELVTHENNAQSYPPSNYQSRSVIIGDNVHFLQANQYWSQDWEGTGPVSGPE